MRLTYHLMPLKIRPSDSPFQELSERYTSRGFDEGKILQLYKIWISWSDFYQHFPADALGRRLRALAEDDGCEAGLHPDALGLFGATAQRDDGMVGRRDWDVDVVPEADSGGA